MELAILVALFGGYLIMSRPTVSAPSVAAVPLSLSAVTKGIGSAVPLEEKKLGDWAEIGTAAVNIGKGAAAVISSLGGSGGFAGLFGGSLGGGAGSGGGGDPASLPSQPYVPDYMTVESDGSGGFTAWKEYE